MFSLGLRLRFSTFSAPVVEDSEASAGAAVTWPAGSPLEELFGLDGFEEE